MRVAHNDELQRIQIVGGGKRVRTGEGGSCCSSHDEVTAIGLGDQGHGGHSREGAKHQKKGTTNTAGPDAGSSVAAVQLGSYLARNPKSRQAVLHQRIAGASSCRATRRDAGQSTQEPGDLLQYLEQIAVLVGPLDRQRL